MPTYPSEFTFDLVQLSTLPTELWVGRGVFHPHAQIGAQAYWLAEEEPFFGDVDVPSEEEEELGSGPSYDVGVVMSWEAENWRNEPNNPAAHEVNFLTGNGGSLHYGASNLWTPRLPSDIELLAMFAKEDTP